jgi:hypothetical protein
VEPGQEAQEIHQVLAQAKEILEVAEAALYLHILVVVAVALVLLVEQGLDQLLVLEVLGRNPV